MFDQGFAQQQRQTPRNRDITVQADIELADVLTGKNLIIQYQLQTGRLKQLQLMFLQAQNMAILYNTKGLAMKDIRDILEEIY